MWRRIAWIATIFILCAGCTSVTVYGDATLPGSRPITHGELPSPSSNSFTIVSTIGWGIVPTTNGFVLGYSKELVFFGGDPTECRTIIIIEDKENIENFKKFLEQANISLGDVCIPNIRGNDENK